MHPTMRLYEDVLSSAENVEFRLPPLPRFIFIVHGSARIAGTTLNEGEAWQGETAITVNHIRTMSALPPKADIRGAKTNGR